jgi:hypothetical protein
MKQALIVFAVMLCSNATTAQTKNETANNIKNADTSKVQLPVKGNKLTNKVKSAISVFEPIVKMNFPNTNAGGNNNGSNGTGKLPKGIKSPYNSDGSANLGQQYNVKYGCYLNALQGKIVDAGEAAEIPESIDLIFAAYKGTGIYYLLTPSFAHDQVMADAVWGSATTNNPVKSWASVNETELAETNLTATDFNNIENNNQLNAAAAKVQNWIGYLQFLNKLDNKVLALRVHLDNRKLFALILVQEHMGTDGSNGYLKIKIKVTGLDNNNDDQPGESSYKTR